MVKYNRIIIFYIFIFCIINSCSPTEPPVKNEAKIIRWESVSEFANMDIRYMLKFRNSLYVCAVNENISGNPDTNGYFKTERSVIYKTSDGVNWEKIGSFRQTMGAMCINGDSIFVLASDSIFYYLPNLNEWKARFKTPDGLSDAQATGDIVFYEGNLYGMQSLYASGQRTFRIYPNGTSEEVKGFNGWPYAGTKFIKIIKNNVEKIYCRGYWTTSLFFEFNGEEFIPIQNGLSKGWNPSNSMAVKRDTLFAGFTEPSNIKYLVGGSYWVTLTDSIPLSESAFFLSPPLYTQSTAITFAGERMFVSTNSIGVIEWTKQNEWKRVQCDGLLKATGFGDLKDLYYPITFLENINGCLFVGYGTPGYAPWGGIGVYKLKIDDISFKN